MASPIAPNTMIINKNDLKLGWINGMTPGSIEKMAAANAMGEMNSIMLKVICDIRMVSELRWTSRSLVKSSQLLAMDSRVFCCDFNSSSIVLIGLSNGRGSVNSEVLWKSTAG